MQVLIDFQDSLLLAIKEDFQRFLSKKINWNQRMIGIKGPRGAGKTTLMLQHLKFTLSKNQVNGLYVTADHPWFYQNTLLDTAMSWFQKGGQVLLIDEVHKYPNWSRELKNIYDGLPQLQVIFSASSALDIYRGESDLSRRVISYSLPGLSFREYLKLSEVVDFPSFSLEDLQKRHREISQEVISKFRPLPHFEKYLSRGYLPVFIEGEHEYGSKLEQIINTVVDTDLAYISSYNAGTAAKVKKLLGVIAESAPFKPNVSAISAKLSISRDRILEHIYQLKDARILNVLLTKGKGISRLQKPDKLYLENTNLSFAINSSPDKGALRETFLLNQLLNAGYEVFEPKKGDFWVNGLTLEVGGKNKSSKQVISEEKYLIASDDIETGWGEKVPLWLFGFLY
ncbi:MAG TPA: AAA family ATPase [Algoriphagus sp.]|jgi:predicted AAA+ superfamily ATPase|uniref:ATP-binding protein n=1 Tax=unclassified Algoriphagus TaxID=2641541 RepID=UPI000C5EB0D0|nr:MULTISPECIES: AAA family ATPase [unclassified Algoriphagus]MAL14397.1 AAA family ATPase [Algoriphagus sp.]MAN87207.1 AAA family ATPase [Algoriphagus sp.]QYH40944.1 AAA family ATPase [Algoriphagus sp. NBT04N3]HAD53094.1 AAA family ATPase [Algoriphagus sp.]HAS60416.1 AAA family ATPase [Algoriphagus sp.]|tara:strand:+ start:812 stop:2005 length:1194 start_codon:yes stop_codon:yes gene_type:complete